MDLSRTVTEINGDFRRKSPIFPTPRVFDATAEGDPLRIGYRRRGLKSNKLVRPRWPYDMRPSARAENYIRDAGL